MSPSTRWLHLCFLVATTLGLAPPVANPALDQPLSMVNSTDALLLTPSALNSSRSSDTEESLNLDDNVQSLNGTSKTPFCDGSKFGYDLDKESCLDAWARIPTDSRTVTYGARAIGHFEAPLPVRYLSRKSPVESTLSRFAYRSSDAEAWPAADGKCYIDINRAREAIWDVATNMEVSTAARRLLDMCVTRESRVRRKPATGGRLSGVGEYSI